MSVTSTDLWRMSALDLADAIRSRQTSSQEVIESHLRRIETVNRCYREDLCLDAAALEERVGITPIDPR